MRLKMDLCVQIRRVRAFVATPKGLTAAATIFWTAAPAHAPLTSKL